MNTASSYVPLHLHSNWSLLEGASTIEEYVEAASRMGLHALAITDTNALYGAVPFYKAAKSARIKPIIGAEITSLIPLSPRDQGWNDNVGAHGVRPPASAAPRRAVPDPLSPRETKCGTAGSSSSEKLKLGTVPSFPCATGGLSASAIPSPAGRGGEGEGKPVGAIHESPSPFPAAHSPQPAAPPERGRDEGESFHGPHFSSGPSAVFLVRNSAGYKNLCRLVTARQLDPSFDLVTAAEKYNDGLFVLSSNLEFLRAAAPRVENLFAELPATFTKKRLREIFSAARDLGLPLVASSDAHFVSPDRRQVHRVLCAIRENALVDNLPDSACAPPSAYLMSAAEMSAFFKLVPEALANTLRIAQECNFDFTFGKYHFPHTGVPDGETPFSYLSKLAFEGARERCRPLTPAVMNRLAYELDVIEKLNFPEYFLIVEDIVRAARSKGIPIAGRGSAADSLVAYCLGITIVDPIRHDLYFERFLNLSRTDCPDIDLDICWKRRDEVIDYVYKKYGQARVAMISTYVTYQAKSAFRDVARVFGLPLEEIDGLTMRLPHYGACDIEDAVKTLPEAADFPINDEPYRTIVSIARQIDSYPRHLGVHLGGLVISDAPLTDYLPLQMATKGIVISQFNMHPVEELGLVKMDLLGQRALSVVFDAAKDVRRLYGVDINFLELPDRDPKVAFLVRRGRTIGGFQIESPGMRNLLQMMRARDKNDLLIGLSLIRPGPAASGMKEHYVRRRRGLEKPFYLHESMRQALSGTYGVMLYQEDILKVAQAVAGFDLAVGDELRKAISKGRSPEAMAAIRDKFISGAKSRGVDERAAAGIYELVRNFAAYSYCKAHATTYAEISYATMFLKAHYPASFHAARINNVAGFYHSRVYLEEARRLGVAILPLDINESALEFTTGNSLTDTGFQIPSPLGVCATGRLSASDNVGARRAVPASSATRRACGELSRAAVPVEKLGTVPSFHDAFIRAGFSAVKNLSRRTVEKILSERAKRPFESFADFIVRVDAAKSECESLVSAGAFCALGRTRPECLLELDSFTNGGAAALEAARSTNLPEYSLVEILALEDETMEMTPSAHPMTPFVAAARDRGAVPARRIHDFRGKIATLSGFLVTRRRAPTKNGDYMEFATFEDETDIFEVTLFPDAYRRFGRLLCSAGPFLIKGKVEDQYGALTVTAAYLDYLLGEPRAPLRRPLASDDAAPLAIEPVSSSLF